MESIPISTPSNRWYIARPDLPNKVDFFALNIAVDSILSTVCEELAGRLEPIRNGDIF